MKKLYIVRHSKAVETAPDHSDFNRCLAESGISKAKLISEHLSSQDENIDLMLSSPACRALETARIFADAFQFPADQIQTREHLYHFGGIEFALEILSGIEDKHETVMIFGHNPTFNALAWHLCDSFREALPTCGVVGLELPIKSWSKIKNRSGKLLSYLTKRRLQS